MLWFLFWCFDGHGKFRCPFCTPALQNVQKCFGVGEFGFRLKAGEMGASTDMSRTWRQ